MGTSLSWFPAAAATPVPVASLSPPLRWINMEPPWRSGSECLKAACPPSSRTSETSGATTLVSWVDPPACAVARSGQQLDAQSGTVFSAAVNALGGLLKIRTLRARDAEKLLGIAIHQREPRAL